MQKINFLTLSTIASLVLIGCGGSSTNSTNTGTGYYKDSAVAGVDYVCGTQTGKTDKEGKFTFEEGKECKFSLAGIPLRTTSADKLIDGGTILEDNPKVAKFLQSIDADGDLSNGIQITDEVLTALTTALEESNSTSTLPEGTVLTEVVASVGHDVTDVTGDVRTDEQVQEHLAQTQTEITKELLAGKTFYMVNIESQNLGTVEFNEDVTQLTFTEEDGTKKVFSTEIKANTIIDENGIHYIDNVTEKYIVGHDTDGEWKFYFNKSDAQQALEASVTNGGGESASDLEKLIVGKTYYITAEDSYTDENGNVVNNNHVETLTFNADGKTVTISWVQNGETKSNTFNYSIQGDTCNINGTADDGETFTTTFKAPVTETDDYISFSGHDGRFYKTYALAEAALNNR